MNGMNSAAHCKEAKHVHRVSTALLLLPEHDRTDGARRISSGGSVRLSC